MRNHAIFCPTVGLDMDLGLFVTLTFDFESAIKFGTRNLFAHPHDHARLFDLETNRLDLARRRRRGVWRRRDRRVEVHGVTFGRQGDP